MRARVGSSEHSCQSRDGNRRQPHVLLACSGLDHARRGFESFARECFDALRDESGVRIELVKGSGPGGPGERSIPALRRDRAAARSLGRLLGVRPFRLEALAFAGSLQPVILRRAPDVVYLSEWDTARALAVTRAFSRQRFRMLLCNGGFAAHGFGHLDHVQELTPAAREYVVARGDDPARHTVLPLGFHIAPKLTSVTCEQRQALRDRLALPRERPIVLSVAALDRHHKRLDYLIEEFAALPRPRPFLLLVGEPDAETEELRSLARARLGEGDHAVRTVPRSQVDDLYRVSDVFVLASLVEAQGRALIEAASHGLPCIAHDSRVTRFALGSHGLLDDLSAPRSLTCLLQRQLVENAERARHRSLKAHHHVYERFSWDRLRRRYVELFRRVAAADQAPATANSTVSSSTGEEVWR